MTPKLIKNCYLSALIAVWVVMQSAHSTSSALITPTITPQRVLTTTSNPSTVFVTAAGPASPRIAQSFTSIPDSSMYFGIWLTNLPTPKQSLYCPQTQQLTDTPLTGLMRYIEMLEGLRAVRHTDNSVDLLSFQYSSGLIASSASQNVIRLSGFISLCATGVKNTTYFLHLNPVDINFDQLLIHKVDVSTLMSTTFQPTFSNGLLLGLATFLPFHMQADTFVVFDTQDNSDNSYPFAFDYVTQSLVREFPYNGMRPFSSWSAWQVDNLRAMRVYRLGDNVLLQQTDLDLADSNSIIAGPTIGVDINYSGFNSPGTTTLMHNCGSFQYLLVGMATMKLVSKVDFTQVSGVTMPDPIQGSGGSWYVDDASLQVFGANRNNFTVGMMWKTPGSGGNYFDMVFYDLIFDICVERDASGKCIQCAPGEYKADIFANPSNPCLLPKDITAGYGPDLTTNLIVKCADSNCNRCFNNFQLCTQCREASQHFLRDSRCVFDQSPITASARFDTATQTLTLTFSEPVRLAGPSPFWTVSVFDAVAQTPVDSLTVAPTADSATASVFSFALSASAAVLKGTAKVSAATGVSVTALTSNRTFVAFPVECGVLQLGRDAPTVAAIAGTVTVLNTARGPFNLVVAGLAPPVASFLDMVVSTLTYLKLFDGPLVAYPERILSNTLEMEIIPVAMPNPFPESSVYCTPSDVFIRNEYDCGIMVNSGLGLLQLLGTCLCCVAVTFATRAIISRYERQQQQLDANSQPTGQQTANQPPETQSRAGSAEDTPKPPLTVRAARFLGEAYGLQLVTVKLDGLQLDLLLQAMVNLRFVDRSVFGYFSLLVALLVLAYYLVFALACCVQASLVADLVLPRDTAATKLGLDKAVAQVGTRFPALKVVGFALDGLQPPTKRVQLWTAPLTVAKNVALSALVVCFDGRLAAVQSGLAAAVETAYLVFLCVGAKKASRIEHWTNASSQFFLVCYLLGKIPTTYEIPEKARQSVFGMWMAVCLIAIVSISILFALLTILISIVEKVKGCCKKSQHLNLQDISSSQLSQTGAKENSEMIAGTAFNQGAVCSTSSLPVPVPDPINKPAVSGRRHGSPQRVKLPSKNISSVMPKKPKQPEVIRMQNRPWTPESFSNTDNPPSRGQAAPANGPLSFKSKKTTAAGNDSQMSSF